MKFSKGFFETAVLDLALGVMLIRFVRGRNSFQGSAGGTPSYPLNKWGKAAIAIDLIRKLVSTQLFFLVMAKSFAEGSWMRTLVAWAWNVSWEGRMTAIVISESAIQQVDDGSYLVMEDLNRGV